MLAGHPEMKTGGALVSAWGRICNEGWWCLPMVVSPGHGVFRKWWFEMFHILSDVFCDPLRLEVVCTQRLCQC